MERSCLLNLQDIFDVSKTYTNRVFVGNEIANNPNNFEKAFSYQVHYHPAVHLASQHTKEIFKNPLQIIETMTKNISPHIFQWLKKNTRSFLIVHFSIYWKKLKWLKFYIELYEPFSTILNYSKAHIAKGSAPYPLSSLTPWFFITKKL